MPQLLISDANIFIDLEVGHLIPEFFDLPYSIAVLDILYEEELKENHSYLQNTRLRLLELSAENMCLAQTLGSQHRKLSSKDIMTMLLAKQEACPLLTGDKELRTVATREGVRCMGTIWLLEQMLTNNLLTYSQTYNALKDMESNGRRLPFEEAFRKIAQFKP